MMKMQVKKLLRRCFLGEIFLCGPSVWYFHFHYEGQPHMFSYLYFAQSLLTLSETNQANLLPAMTVCPECRSAYRKEQLRRHGIRNLEVSIVKN